MTEEELKRQTEREIRWRIGFRLLPWGLLILIICIGLLKDCVRSRDPIDDSINRSGGCPASRSMRHHPKRIPCSLRHQQCRYNRTVERNPTTPTVESGILQTPRQCSILLRREPAPNRHLRLCRIRPPVRCGR